MMTSPSASYKAILKLTLPITVGAIAQNIILATDAIFMAKVNEVSLDAVGISGLFFSTLFVIGLGISVGVQIIIARLHGEKNHTGIKDVFQDSFKIFILLGLVLWGLMDWLGAIILKDLIQSEKVLQESLLYLENREWGILIAMMSLAFRALFLGISRSSIITWATIATAIANVILNYLLIFGHAGFPQLGIAGAGMASSMAEILGLICFYIYLKRNSETKAFFQKLKWNFSMVNIQRIHRIASPLMLQNLLSHTGWFLFFIVIEKSGERALAISVVIRIIYMFQMAPFWGFSAATNTMVSYAIGENKSQEVKPLLKRISILAIMTSLLFAIPNFFFPTWIIGLALNNSGQKDLLHACIPTLHVVTVALIFLSVSTTYFSGVSGTGNTRYALFLESIIISIYLLLAWMLSSFANAGVEMIWLCEVFYFLAIGITSYHYIQGDKWKEKI